MVFWSWAGRLEALMRPSLSLVAAFATGCAFKASQAVLWLRTERSAGQAAAAQLVKLR